VFPESSSRILAIGIKSHGGSARLDLAGGGWISFWEDSPAMEIDFSRDGRRAVWRHYRDHTLWVSDAAGRNRRQLTQPPLDAHEPHWSADGERIAFMGQMPGGKSRIWTVNPSVGDPRELPANDPEDQGVPTWSPDGRFIVYGELRLRKPEARMSIHILDVSAGSVRTLPDSEGKWTPRWSPDGRYILAESADFHELFLYSTATRRWTSLVGFESIDDPVWSSDSHYVQFRSRQRIVRIHVASRRLERLPAAPPLEADWAGLAPDGSPLVLRAIRDQEIYSLRCKFP
jgi:Tol biopolymer transport system component